MATIASNVQWGDNPKIYFDFSYDKKREGSTQYYKVTVSCQTVTGSHYFGYPIYLEFKVAGSVAATYTLKKASPSRWDSVITYTTGWMSVANKTTGTTPLDIRIYSGSGSTRNTTYSYNLDVDPATSLISATDANIGSTSVITITKYSSNFTTTVSYKAAGQSAYTEIWTKQSYTSHGWTVPDALYSLISGAREIDVELKCETYSSGTLIGTTYCDMTATTNATKCQPEASITAKDVREATVALTGNNRKIIKGVSTLEATVNSKARNSAKLVNTTVTCGSKKQVSTANPFVATFAKAESATASSATKDSRDYVTYDSDELTLVNYIVPTANPTIARETPTSDVVNISLSGIWFNGSFGAVTNSLTAKVRYKPKGQASYTAAYKNMTVVPNGNNYTASTQLTGLPYTDAYDVEIVVTDAVHSGSIEPTIVKYDEVRKGIPVFDWGENDFAFNVPVSIDGTLTIGGTTVTESQLVKLLALIK